MAAYRSDNLRTAARKTWARGGIAGFYQGLIPWVSACLQGASHHPLELRADGQAWIEAGSKGAILMLTASATERTVLGILPGQYALAGGMGGVAGGLVQTYAVMGATTTMKTVEITRSKMASAGHVPPSTLAVAKYIYRKEGIKGLNKGVNAVALRQMTGWMSRIGITRFNEGLVRRAMGLSPDEKLNNAAKIAASCGGGALSCWNQPLEVRATAPTNSSHR